MVVWIVLLAIAPVVAVLLFMRRPQFGAEATGGRRARMERSEHYNREKGAFENLNSTPTLTEGHSVAGLLFDQFFRKHPGRRPSGTIPSVTTDLKNLPAGMNALVWFGHSSYLLQVDGKKFLVDPVFSGSASPLPGLVKAFDGSNSYGVEDMPEIDYLLITHDHYDHLDYRTITALRSRVTKVICGLGVGAHLERWGYDADRIAETDWWEHLDLGSGFTLDALPSRHFSGRRFRRNTTLWGSYALRTPSLNLYLGGDSGYDTHFAEIGEKYGPFDLAILENGQYNVAWKAIHMLPEDVLMAARDLKAHRVLPVHSGKFTLALHPWNEPLREVDRLNAAYDIPLVTPMIGEVVDLDRTDQRFGRWWEFEGG